LRISAEAQRDLDEIWDYIAGDNWRAADALIDEVEERFRLLSEQPLLGQDRPDLAPGLRFIPVGSYLIFYVPLSDGVEVVRVTHGARDYGSEYF
jgi:toxin ParE1/3/4